MSDKKNIVVLGGSYAGLSAAHYFLKHIQPSLPREVTYHVYLINPSTHFYHRVGAPRATASSQLLPNSKVFHDIPAGFAGYSPDLFTFIQGKATTMDTQARTVTIRRTHGDNEENLAYHALVLATGTKSFAPTLSNQGGLHDEVVKALEDVHTRLKSAKSVIIAGGGPAGVETAGEVGEFLNGAAGWFSKKPSNPKAKVTLLAGSSKLLPMLRPGLAKQAEVLLARVGVDTIYNDRVEKTEELSAAGRMKITLSSGKEMECDIYIPATGVVPMTNYVPKELLTEKGYVKTNTKTLRVDKAGPRVYCVGDCGSYTRGGILDLFEAIPALETNLKRDLLLSDAREGAKPKWSDRNFTTLTAETQIVPVGQSKGVGAFNGNKLPGIMVYMIKGRDYMCSSAVDIVSGNKWKKEDGWKPRDG